EINGVAQVAVVGAARYAVRVDVDPLRLAAYGIGLDEVAAAIGDANANLPTGTMNGRNQSFTLLASGRLLRADLYQDVIIAHRGGQTVRLRDVAHVFDGVENDKSELNFFRNGRPERAIAIQVMKQPNTNVVAIADEVKRLVPIFQAALPPSIELNLQSD